MNCTKGIPVSLHDLQAAAGKLFHPFKSLSETLQELLTAISPKLENSLLALLIGSIISSVVTNQATDLQIGLGVLMRGSKELISHMYDYRVTCSYAEILRYKKSVVVAAVSGGTDQRLSNVNSSFVQVVCDNFDAQISSPNGKATTHSLAMIFMHPSTKDVTTSEDRIPRLSKSDMHKPLHDEEDESYYRVYDGPKKPRMPCVSMSNRTDTDERQRISHERAKEHDFAFFKDVILSDDCPEHNGYNTRLCRQQGHSLKPHTEITYFPLIDMPPSEYTTIFSAMVKAQNICKDLNHPYVVMTLDQQLYRVAVHLKWQYPELLANVYLRLGGMHLLMSYCGCIGTLLTNSGIVEILESSFAGVQKMLNGKKYPQNVRALRMLTEELLRTIIQDQNFQTMKDLIDKLDYLSTQSRTTKMWVDCLIKPVLIIMRYIRAERESDWCLHLASVDEMLPLFFAAGHMNYARYAAYYLRSMEDLPDEIHSSFLQGHHTMHHIPGLYNGIWSDMAIETTFMRYGHSKGGIIGITLKPETLKTWAYSLHGCHQLLNDLNDMRNKNTVPIQTTHKEESPSRIQSDMKDRCGLRNKLELCIDPLNPELHPKEGIVNIVTGEITKEASVNIDQVVKIGE